MSHQEKRSESQFYSLYAPCSIANKLVTDSRVLAEGPYEPRTGPEVLDWFLLQIRELDGRCR